MDQSKSLEQIMQEIQDFKASAMEPGTNIFEITRLESVTAIIVDMETGTILFSTPDANNLFGYLKDELDGKNISDIIPERFRVIHADHLKKYSQKPMVRPMGERKMQLFGINKNGEEFGIKIGLHPLMIAGKRCVAATIIRESEL